MEVIPVGKNGKGKGKLIPPAKSAGTTLPMMMPKKGKKCK